MLIPALKTVVRRIDLGSRLIEVTLPAGLRGNDVSIGGSAFHPGQFPLRLPDIESETDADRGLVLFKPPPAAQPGVRVWLTLPPGRTVNELDAATRERLKALGYVGPG